MIADGSIAPVNKMCAEVIFLSKTAVALLSMLAAISTSVSVLAAPSNGYATVAKVSAPRCLIPHGAGPGYDASIGNQQNGNSVCITVGERLLVVLSGGQPNASAWQAIHVSKPGILQVAPLRGTVGRNFKATRIGSVEVTSERPACPQAPSGAPTCDAIELWRVTVIVSALTSTPPKPSGTGIYGLLVASPTCPVERIGRPCPPRPVVAAIDIRTTDGSTAAFTHTDCAGRYAVSVRPGNYALIVITGATFPRCPSREVTVPSGSPLRADITCDTGIR